MQLPLSLDIPYVKEVAKYGIGAVFFESKNGKTAGEIAQIHVLKWISESGIGLVVPDKIAELIQKSEAAVKNISKIKEYLPLFPGEIKWEQADIEMKTEPGVHEDKAKCPQCGRDQKKCTSYGRYF